LTSRAQAGFELEARAMVIVDQPYGSITCAALENSETRWLDGHLEGQRLELTDLFLCEVLQGIHDHGEFARVRADLFEVPRFPDRRSELAVPPLKTTGTCTSRATPSARRSIA
jgi:hypothetical protein